MCPSLFHLGPLTLHTYGLLIAIGFLLGLSVMKTTLAPLGLHGDVVDRLSVLILLAGLLGARIMFFAVDGFVGLRADPLVFFRIWEGGLAFYGGVCASLIAIAVFARRRKIPLLKLCDALVPPLLIAHALGRLGCLAAGCCYGKPAGEWPGITFTNPESLAPRYIPLIPTQPMESAALLALFGFSMMIFRRDAITGRLSAFYLCGYAVVRFLMEFLRGDDRGQFVLGLSPSQLVAVVMLAAGVGVFFYGKKIDRR